MSDARDDIQERRTNGWLMMLGAAILLVAAACGSAEPDTNSGGDAYRNEAQPMPLEEMVTGELDMEAGDQTDWKSAELADGDKATVTLSADKKGAAVSVTVFDKYGAEIAKGVKKGGSEDPVKVQFKAPSEGKYFVRIRHTGGSKTTYSVELSLGGGGGGGASPDI